MKILVIGHQGYLGEGLFKAFSKKHDVVGWGRREDLFALSKGQLLDLKIEVVVNCAVATERMDLHYDVASDSHRINVEGAMHLSQCVMGTPIRFVQLSTKDIFGSVYTRGDVDVTDNGYRPKFLVGENHSFQPESRYAKTKLMAEWILESHPLTTIVRLSTCYTDHPHRHENWMARMIGAGLRGQPIELTNKGFQFRDPLHVDDLAGLIEAIIEKRKVGVYNAGGGADNITTVKEFLDALPKKPAIIDKAGGDLGFAFDIAKAKKDLGWEPRIRWKERLPVLLKNA